VRAIVAAMARSSLAVLDQYAAAVFPPGYPDHSRTFWARTDQAAGLAAYAPAGTQLRPEPDWTVGEVPGFARGTSNASP
jgi:hypothetical protein